MGRSPASNRDEAIRLSRIVADLPPDDGLFIEAFLP